MAYPTSRLRTVVARAFNNADSTAIRLRSKIGALNVQMAAGPVTATLILDDLLAELRSSRSVFTASLNTSGILVYAKDQFGDATIDLLTDLTTLIAGIDAVIAWIVKNFSTDVEGFLQSSTLSIDGTLTDRNFSTVETAGLRVLLQRLR